ncbi:membrane protein insertion efficiency factor YidD [Oceanivirga salmonicida]|uniref:membrane protein insertion efficiency factor YidD n=1 Tax=Oceanivirga salmonicida TaxID=1769291 RepID=UPI0009E6B8B1|nr:membrane protein insertion efficiency factor YidD [Oceanivirga salmonicida]
MKRILIKIIKIYQKISNKYLRKRCKYYPTCSEYMKQAIEKYGIFKGIYLGTKRILRCNPFTYGGYDPLK